MEKWEEMYRSYININNTVPIFQQERCVEGIKQSGSGAQTLRNFSQSTLYKKYFTQNNTTYVGVGNRRRGKPNKEVQNSSFSDFIEQNKELERNCEYRQFIKNAEAEYKSVSKYDRGQPHLDEEAWNLSKEWTIRHFGPGKMAGSIVVPREMAHQEMDKTTSPGWPHNLKHKNKTTLFADKNHSKIVDDYWSMISRIQDQQEWVPIWQCSEKTELRKVEKLNENKVRTFTCAPVEHSVALNRMCLDMNNKFYNTNNQTWSFVGGNKFDSGFHRLWQRLSKHPNAFELDETAYDSSLFLRAMGEMVDIRFEFLSEDEKTFENKNRLENLYQSIIHSVIIMQNGEMFQKHTGNPSGSANTIVDNTIILFRLCAYAWIVLTREYTQKQRAHVKNTINNPDVKQRTQEEIVEKYGYGGFMEHVEAALNGDDNTFTVSDEMVHIYNAETIASVWSDIGVITNTPNKNFKQKVEEVSFLSQSFSLHRGIWLPTPETSKVYSSLMYGSDHDDPRWHLLRACALRVDSWSNIEMRGIIKKYIEYLWKKYKLEFSQDTTLKFGEAIVSMSNIMSMYRTDEWIFRLYSSHESELFDKYFSPITLALMIEVAQTEELGSKLIEITDKQSIKNKTIKMSSNQNDERRLKKKIKKQLIKKQLKSIGKLKRTTIVRAKPMKNMKNYKKIRGKGDYSIGDFVGNFMPWNDDTASTGVVNKTARGVGNAVGDVFGVGKQVGNAASWLSRAFGFGDYAIKSNTLSSNNIAQFKNHGTIEFAHREFIKDINSSEGFVNEAHPINPGNSTLFPWLSGLATKFEQYEMLGLIFEFKTTSAMAVGSVNTGLGTVIMATDYDVLDSAYVDKRSMEVSEFSTSAAPCYSQVHPIECDPKQNVMRQMFIQSGDNVGAYPDDPRFSALGNFQIATSGMQAVSTIGELWVSYHVRLHKPQLEPLSGISTTSAHQKLTQELTNSPTLGPLVTTNDAALSFSIVSGRLHVTCASSAGFGTYLISWCVRSSNPTGLYNTAPYGASHPYADAVGAVFTPGVAYTSTGTNGSAFFQAIAVSDADTTATLTYNAAATTYIITFSTVGDLISLPTWTSPTGTLTQYHDCYVVPYNTPNLGYKEQQKMMQERGNAYDDIRKMVQEMKIQQEKTDKEFRLLKEEISDEMEKDAEYEKETATSPTPITVYATHRKNAQQFINCKRGE